MDSPASFKEGANVGKKTSGKNLPEIFLLDFWSYFFFKDIFFR